jgi:crotonobetainyl-CoA:carnitine CoA-transferase CaiB-like acyl-CoA transferase
VAGFLSPYRVLDLTDHRGLLAGRMLGQLGADVVQVEPPGGSPARRVGPFTDAPAPDNSLYWSAYASAKRGLALDLGTPPGRDLLLRLAASADFLIESETPGVMAARGLGHGELIAANPALVHVSITAFGSTGPKANWAASEITLWAAGGALWPCRDGDSPPLRFSAPQAWLHAAGDAAGAAMMAHFARLQTGRGQHVDISAQISVAEATLSLVLADAVGDPRGRPPPEGPVLPPRGASSWATLDGRVEMAIGMGGAGGGSSNALWAWMREEGEAAAPYDAWDWVKVLARVQAGELTPADFLGAREAIAAFFARRPTAVLVEQALKRRILLTEIQTAATLASNAHFEGRGSVVDVDEGGAARRLPHAWAKTGGAFAPLRPAPRIGEHSVEILRDWLGLDPREAAALAAGAAGRVGEPA